MCARFALDSGMLRASPGRLTIVTLALICLAAVSPARAQDATAWDAEAHAAARLIAGAMVKTPNAAFLRAGIEIRLAPDWKTYWRDPGDFCAPPTFDFAGSENVKSVTVLWPAPERFPDGAGGHSIGYLDHVILPLRVTPADAARALSVHLKLDYAICGNLCVPAEAKLELALTGNGAEDATLERAERHVPRRVALGRRRRQGSRHSLRASRADGARERVVVEVARAHGAPVDLFVEGPTPDWALPLARAGRGPAAPRDASRSNSTACRPARKPRARR